MRTAREHRAIKALAGRAARTTVAPPVVAAAVQRTGTPLEPAVRREFEHRLGHDFSAVRIHSDAEATRATAVVGARAYTLGRHIAIREGLYDPSTTEGRRLLSHELTHVVQQAGFRDHQLVGAPVIGADHPSERQAHAGDGAAMPLAAPAVQRDSPETAPPPVDWDAIRPDLIKYLQRLRRDHPGELLYILFELKAAGLLWPALKSMALQRYMTSPFEWITDDGLLSEFDRAFPTQARDLRIGSPRRQTSMGPAEPGVRYPTMSPWEEYQQKMSATRAANFNLLPAIILELSGRDGGQYLVDTAPQAQALAAIGGARSAASPQPKLQPSRPSVITPVKSAESSTVAATPQTTIPPSRPPTALPAQLPQRAMNDNAVLRTDIEVAQQKRAAARVTAQPQPNVQAQAPLLAAGGTGRTIPRLVDSGDQQGPQLAQPAVTMTGRSTGSKSSSSPGTTFVFGEGPSRRGSHVETFPSQRKARLGTWSGTPGNSNFTPDNEAALRRAGFRSIPYRSGYPNFRPFAEATVLLPRDQLAGTTRRHHDVLADTALARQRGWLLPNGEPDVARATAFRTNPADPFTWHHVEGDNVLLLVPRSIHQAAQHAGGFSQPTLP